jgi:hypothetical protein
MAKSNSAVTQLQDQIESIRREAYNAGYSAAMQAVLNFAKQPTAEPQTRSATTRKSPAKAPARRAASTRGAPLAVQTQATPPKGETASRAPRQRTGRRGENAPLIEAALKSLPNHTGRAGDIRKGDQGTARDGACFHIDPQRAWSVAEGQKGHTGWGWEDVELGCCWVIGSPTPIGAAVQ